MMDRFMDTDRYLLNAFRRGPLLRCAIYGISMEAVARVVSRMSNLQPDSAWSMTSVMAYHSLASPLVLGITYGFARLREEDTEWWRQVMLVKAARQLGLGLLIG